MQCVIQKGCNIYTKIIIIFNNFILHLSEHLSQSGHLPPFKGVGNISYFLFPPPNGTGLHFSLTFTFFGHSFKRVLGYATFIFNMLSSTLFY